MTSKKLYMTGLTAMCHKTNHKTNKYKIWIVVTNSVNLKSLIHNSE